MFLGRITSEVGWLCKERRRLEERESPNPQDGRAGASWFPLFSKQASEFLAWEAATSHAGVLGVRVPPLL